MECKNSISLKRKNVLLVAKTIKRKKERKKNDNKLNNSKFEEREDLLNYVLNRRYQGRLKNTLRLIKFCRIFRANNRDFLIGRKESGGGAKVVAWPRGTDQENGCCTQAKN